jgi:chemotaxis signal transduction protein
VGPHLLAADAREICEVREPLQATPIPGAVPGVSGLVNLRGVLVVAGELATLLGFEPAKSEETALVVFEQGERRIALEVDRMVGVIEADSEQLDVDGDLLEALGARDVVEGVGRFADRPYFQLDTKALFSRVLAPEV